MITHKFGEYINGIYIDPYIKVEIESLRMFIEQLKNLGIEFITMNDDGIITKYTEYQLPITDERVKEIIYQVEQQRIQDEFDRTNIVADVPLPPIEEKQDDNYEIH